jgi:hypothetical protein
MDMESDLRRRAESYAQRVGFTLTEKFGDGVHGIVFGAKSQVEPGESAVKVHEREAPYRREREVYVRLCQHGVTEVCGSNVPQLINFDDELWIIHMSVVSRPYVLDFAGAYLDGSPRLFRRRNARLAAQ